jgi:hypothetical protein
MNSLLSEMTTPAGPSNLASKGAWSGPGRARQSGTARFELDQSCSREQLWDHQLVDRVEESFEAFVSASHVRTPESIFADIDPAGLAAFLEGQKLAGVQRAAMCQRQDGRPHRWE